MVGMSLSSRKKRVMAAVMADGVEALLVTHLPDVRYLCGFTGSSGVLVLLAGKAVLFTDGRYTTQAEAEVKGARVEISQRSALVMACEWLEAAGVQRCGFDSAYTTVAALEGMRRAVSAKMRRGIFVALGSIVAGLRQVKDADEIATMREAAGLGCRLFEGIFDVMEAGMTEVEVALALEHRARMAGAERMSFETIVASGARSALPHGKASGAKLPRRGFVTLDFGVMWGGYCSDMTRTVHMGPAEQEEQDVYHSVLEAQMAAIAAVKPGVTAGAVDEAARSVLRRDGLGENFSHSTGHGVGLEIHEGPRLAAKQAQVLKAGMVITIEPGAYLPGRFGVRIEDMVLVTKTGCEVLTPATKAWIQL